MEHSGAAKQAQPRARAGAIAGRHVPRASAKAVAGLAALESLARISVPASVLLLSRGSVKIAAVTSAVALLATAARGFALSFAIERSLRASFEAVVSAALRLALTDLRAERKIGLLAEAAREAAAYEATTIPLLLAHGLAMVLTWCALAAVIGPLWAAALALAAVPLVVALGLGARRIRARQLAAWDAFSDVAIDLRVLVEACLELRAHDREPSFARALVLRARSFAADERRASVWSAASSALPSAMLLVATTTPVGGAVASVIAGSTGVRAAETAIIAGAVLHFALGLGRLLEQRARYAPFRDTLDRFLAAPDASAAGPALSLDPGAARAPAGQDALPSLAAATISFRDVSCRHPHAARATPAHVSFTWRPGRGLLLAGENGAGKSTLVLALLGLAPITEGSIDIDGAGLNTNSAQHLRARCAYLAQSPFVEPGASVAWHVRLLARSPIDDARIDEALRRVGLWRVLVEHADRKEHGERVHPRDVPAGELSGGERQRMHIARILAHEADLVILDEPEAGLDHPTRAEMAALFDQLATERRVLLIAHDPAIVPPSFDRLDVRAER